MRGLPASTPPAARGDAFPVKHAYTLPVFRAPNRGIFFVGVNLLVGTENGLMLLDRSGQGKVYNLITRRRFLQMDVLEGLNVLVTISGWLIKEENCIITKLLCSSNHDLL